VRVRLGWLGLIVCATRLASAHPPLDWTLRQDGEQLAKDGKYAAAIEKFKAADALAPSAANACLVALAYTRAQQWGEGELWLSLCQAHANPKEAMPEWLPVLQRDIATGLAEADVAAVTITVTPADAHAVVRVSSFAADKTFTPRTVYLGRGHHVIVATAPSGMEARQEIDIVDRASRVVVIALPTSPAPVLTELPPSPPSPPPPPPAGPHLWPRRLAIAGAIVSGAGLASYAEMGYAWLQIRDRNESTSTYDRYHPIYTGARVATAGLLAVGAGLLVTSYVLHRSDRETPTITLAPAPGGGVFGVAWQR
jgi:hypothetical protein